MDRPADATRAGASSLWSLCCCGRRRPVYTRRRRCAGVLAEVLRSIERYSQREELSHHTTLRRCLLVRVTNWPGQDRSRPPFWEVLAAMRSPHHNGWSAAALGCVGDTMGRRRGLRSKIYLKSLLTLLSLEAL